MSEPLDLRAAIAKLAARETLSADEARAAFDAIMSGQATPVQIGAFLIGLRVRGETVEEIAAAASVMRDKALKVEAPADAIDIVGTGGDGSGTYNISTAAAFIVAACGQPVAKHGNRALSSKSGAADALAALGVNIELEPDAIARCIREAGLGFMFAPRHHSAMRHVGPARVELGVRTVFNLLGPLCNPAGVRRQMTGVYGPEWVEPVAHALGALGLTRAWVVHGEGLDEVTTTGATKIASLENGAVTVFETTPEEAGLRRASLDDIKGGDAEANAQALRDLLEGASGPYRDISLMNAAAALIVAGRAADLKEGVARAAEAIDSGAARMTLNRLITASNAQS